MTQENKKQLIFSGVWCSKDKGWNSMLPLSICITIPIFMKQVSLDNHYTKKVIATVLNSVSCNKVDLLDLTEWVTKLKTLQVQERWTLMGIK